LFETRRLDLLVKFLLLLTTFLTTTLHLLITKTIKKLLQPDVDQNPAREIQEERDNRNPKIKAKTREEAARAVLVVIQKVKTPPKMSRTTFLLLVEEFVDLLLVEVVDHHKTKRYKKKKSSRKQQFS